MPLPKPAHAPNRPPPPRSGRRSGPVAALIFFFLLFFFTLFVPPPAGANWAPVIARLAGDGFERQGLEALFARPEVRFEADAMAGKLRELLRNRAATETEREARRKTVRRDYLAPHVITRALAYKRDNAALLDDITRLYGVPKEIVVSILLIETRLGEYTGDRVVFNRLASMARSDELEPLRPHLGKLSLTAEEEAYARRRSREKADWAYGELKALLLFAAGHDADPLAIRGSHYGAIGQCQFMPSNLFLYGVDGDGDGRIDPFSTPDALHSIANYLRGHGWQAGLTRQDKYRVIFRYNHSAIYANTVLAISEKLRVQGKSRP
jgi:membrane-bound lytic murein transglycosylase B